MADPGALELIAACSLAASAVLPVQVTLTMPGRAAA
jgi:hypothetical protein